MDLESIFEITILRTVLISRQKFISRRENDPLWRNILLIDLGDDHSCLGGKFFFWGEREFLCSMGVYLFFVGVFGWGFRNIRFVKGRHLNSPKISIGSRLLQPSSFMTLFRDCERY